jgi:hypothetical protein
MKPPSLINKGASTYKKENMKPSINSTQFYCKQCGHLVWIVNQAKETIIDGDTGETNAELGLCRSCFVYRKVPKQIESSHEDESKKQDRVGNSFYEKVALGEEECPEDCFWKGRCLKGTKFDNGKGGCRAGDFYPDADFSLYSPCFMVRNRKIEL